MDADLKEVRFDKWCSKCKHYANKFADKGVSGEFQKPCGECMLPLYCMRRGTEKPVYWEENT